MAAKKKSVRNPSVSSEPSVGMTGVALVASILGNLHLYGDNDKLRSTVEVLQRLIQDWQAAYNILEGQLKLALRTNVELNSTINLLREQVRTAQLRANEAQARALKLEAQRGRARD